MEQKEMVQNIDLAQVIEEAFHLKPSELVEKRTLEDPIASLKDSILEIKLLPEEQHRPIEDLTNQLRDLEVVLKVAADENFPCHGAALRRYRRRSLRLPNQADLQSSLSTVQREKEKEKERQEAQAKKRKEIQDRFDRYTQLKAAVNELTALGGEHFETTAQKSSPGYLPPAELRPLQLFIHEMKKELTGSDPGLQARENASEHIELVQPTHYAPASEVTRSTITQRIRCMNGTPEFKPLQLGQTGFRLKPSAMDSLSTCTRQILKEHKLDTVERPLDQVVDRLQREATALTSNLNSLLGQPMQHTFKRIGDTMVMITTPMPSVWSDLVIGGNMELPATYVFPTDYRVTGTHGSVMPVGIADLLVVKQQLMRYEATDVAHIESILRGERKEREHTRRRETEELTFLETEMITSEERELESTNRFEMSRETSETIKEDASLKAGITVSGKYGPSVDFSASAEGSMSRSKEEATKTAATFAQDVTQRSANKVTERVLQRSSLRVTNEVNERNSHMLDNVGGGANISGIYQWVNKVYHAQMFNYGLRALYDFIIPEPGAFLIAAFQKAHKHAIEIEKPVTFDLQADQITEENYHYWVHQYGATDVIAPPEIYKTYSLNYDASSSDEHADFNHSGQITIDDEYEAVWGSVGTVETIWEGDYCIDVILGSRDHRLVNNGGWIWSTTLDGERGSIPFALITWKVANIGVAVEVKCQRTQRSVLAWQLDTHAKLTQAYKARLSEYEEKLANLEMQAGITIQGKTPALNLELMNDELKKNCISIMTAQHYDMFGAIDMGSNGLPQIDLHESEAEGAYVRFFEQAFEWEHMTWITYPYFWGRKSEWEARIAYEDTDPLFNQFLKAGYARVVVPARPGFEGAIDHFITYGELWNGGPLPTISNPLYLPIADEIAERLDRPGDEYPQGDPWLVRIPTTLVHLRADDMLPVWAQDADDEWIEQ
ncbi:hypothetical protein LLG46_15360 [bacterium]|nr:hypothetical protein [bacterium]